MLVWTVNSNSSADVNPHFLQVCFLSCSGWSPTTPSCSSPSRWFCEYCALITPPEPTNTWNTCPTDPNLVFSQQMDGHASGEALHLGFALLKALIITCVKLRADVRCFPSRRNVLVNIIQFPDIGRNAIITTFIKESAFFYEKARLYLWRYRKAW